MTMNQILTNLTMTMGQAHLSEIEKTLRKAEAYLQSLGFEEARDDVLVKVREALSNHLPSVRARLG